MLFVSAALVILGVAVALVGERLFKIILPIIGLVAGFLVGWSGVEAVFGINAVSLPIALITGVLVGALTAVLSYLYFSIALTILVGVLFAYGSMYLGMALGLASNAFVMFMLALGGAVLGLALALSIPLEKSVVIFVSSFYGVAMVLAGVLLAAGDISLNQLHDRGILRAVVDTVDNQFIWLMAWLGAGLIAAHLQRLAAKYDTFDDSFSYTGTTTTTTKQKKAKA